MSYPVGWKPASTIPLDGTRVMIIASVVFADGDSVDSYPYEGPAAFVDGVWMAHESHAVCCAGSDTLKIHHWIQFPEVTQ